MNVLPDIIIALGGGALICSFDWGMRYVILPIFAKPSDRPRGASMTRI